jgi:hypothetical protein
MLQRWQVPETSSAGAMQRQKLRTGGASAWPSKHQAERQRTEAAKRQSGPYQDRARLMAGLAESRERQAEESQHRIANKRESEHKTKRARRSQETKNQAHE